MSDFLVAMTAFLSGATLSVYVVRLLPKTGSTSPRDRSE